MFDRELGDQVTYKLGMIFKKTIEKKQMKQFSKIKNKYERAGAEAVIKMIRANRRYNGLKIRYRWLTGKKW